LDVYVWLAEETFNTDFNGDIKIIEWIFIMLLAVVTIILSWTRYKHTVKLLKYLCRYVVF
jgi:hypothetical protein